MVVDTLRTKELSEGEFKELGVSKIYSRDGKRKSCPHMIISGHRVCGFS